MKIVYDPNSLCHYGVLGMKWGRRKSKAKSSGKNASKSSKKPKYLTDSRKQKIKAVAKTTAKIAGSIAAASILGYAGSVAFNEISNAMASPQTQSPQTQSPQTFDQEVVRSKPDNIINETKQLYKRDRLREPVSGFVLGRNDERWRERLLDAGNDGYGMRKREWVGGYRRR